jgi:hypothetical protein
MIHSQPQVKILIVTRYVIRSECEQNVNNGKKKLNRS